MGVATGGDSLARLITLVLVYYVNVTTVNYHYKHLSSVRNYVCRMLKLNYCEKFHL